MVKSGPIRLCLVACSLPLTCSASSWTRFTNARMASLIGAPTDAASRFRIWGRNRRAVDTGILTSGTCRMSSQPVGFDPERPMSLRGGLAPGATSQRARPATNPSDSGVRLAVDVRSSMWSLASASPTPSSRMWGAGRRRPARRPSASARASSSSADSSVLGELGQRADGVALLDADQADALGVAADQAACRRPGSGSGCRRWW